jgi:transcriptional regulator with XRE-family HTH domain
MPDNSGLQLSDNQLSDEQSRSVAAIVREELARRRISRQHLAEMAKISISTLEKALSGRRPFTLATTIRLEEALGVSLRKTGTDGARGGSRDQPGTWRPRLLLAASRVVPRGELPDVTSVLRRPDGHLCLPD